MTDPAEIYVRLQNFNAVTRWLHGHRYRQSVAVVAELAQQLDRPVRILEIGSGQGTLFGELNGRFDVRYTGIDLEPGFVAAALRQFGGYDNFHVEVRPAQDVEFLKSVEQPDVVFALETLEHIPAGDTVRIVEAIAALRPRRFVCSVPVEIGPIVAVKNIGSWLMGYERYREYSWRETGLAACYQVERLPPHSCRHKGFDWRWLAHTIRQNFEILERRHLPVAMLPSALSTSVYLIARPAVRPDVESRCC